MPLRRLKNTLLTTLARMAIVGLIVAGAWLALQFYTEDEIVAEAHRFWRWWSGLLQGDLRRSTRLGAGLLQQTCGQEILGDGTMDPLQFPEGLLGLA